MSRSDWMDDYKKRVNEYRNTSESGDPYEVPEDEDITTDTRYDNVTPESKPYVASEFSDISELDTEHNKMNQLKKDRKYKKHLDLLESQGTIPVLDMDRGKVKRAEGDITVSYAVNPLSGTQFDQYAGTQEEEEEEDSGFISWLSDLVGSGSGSREKGMLTKKHRSGQIAGGKGRGLYR